MLFWSAPTQGKYSQPFLKMSISIPYRTFFKTFTNLSKNIPRPLPDTSQDFPKITKSDPDLTKKGLQSVTRHANIYVKIQGSKGHPTCRGLKYLEILWWDSLRFVWFGECWIWEDEGLRTFGVVCVTKKTLFIKVGHRCRRSLAGAVFGTKNNTFL